MEKGLGDKEFIALVGKRIEKFRKERNLTRTQLSYLCDMERPNIARIETGGNNLTLITLRKIATALNVEITDILSDL